MSPPPALEEFVVAIQKAAGVRRRPLSVPRPLLLGMSYPIDALAKTFRIRQPISPVRVRKLFRSTSVDPKRLRDLGYQWKYTLEEAFVDWKRELPRDFAK
jgi:hypothetical protein